LRSPLVLASRAANFPDETPPRDGNCYKTDKDRVLARIRPTQLGLWSFVATIAHGAGLMLMPIYLGLCRAADLDKGHAAAGKLINTPSRLDRRLEPIVLRIAMQAPGGSPGPVSGAPQGYSDFEA
jgi:hypothetical protein